jgi:hypothetical protein
MFIKLIKSLYNTKIGDKVTNFNTTFKGCVNRLVIFTFEKFRGSEGTLSCWSQLHLQSSSSFKEG